jgi:hypothetical protein
MAEIAEKIEPAEEKSLVLLSPEGIVMMGAAVILDILGIIFTILDIAYGIGEIPSWISDGVGVIFFGLWLLVRSTLRPGTTEPEELVEKVMEKRRAIKRVARAARRIGRGLRFAIAFIGEVLPVIGALPFWTWFVYSELKS